MKFIITQNGYYIGDVWLPYYGTMIAGGILLSVIVLLVLVLRHKKNPLVALWMGIGALAFGFIGAKALFFIVNAGQVDFNRLFEKDYFVEVMGSGFVFYGGLIGALLFLVFLEKVLHVNVKSYLSIGIPCLPLAHAFGRIGCHLAGCCHGRAYEGWGAVLYVEQDASYFPIQLVEAICLFILAVCLIIYIWRNREPKYSILIYLCSYAVIRFVLEYFRGDVERGGLWIFSTSQWISLCFLLGVAIYAFVRKNRVRSRQE